MRKLLLCLILLLEALFCSARISRDYSDLISEKSQMEILDFLADDMCNGRASGTTGAQTAARFIMERFRSMGLKPYNWHYTQSFLYQDSIVLRNVVGVLPAVHRSDEYVIVSAHFDHLGRLGSRVYSGADDNASGVAALLSIAEAFCEMKRDGNGPDKNIIFVAFDGKELSMSGSGHFVANLGINRSRIVCNVNMDILGTDLEPVGDNKEFIIALGENTLKPEYRGYLSYLCQSGRYRMDLDLTFYGSRDFTRMYYEMSDQNSFAQAGIPAVIFTSGFHDHTYKPSDKPDIINFPLLRKRTAIIFNFINNICIR